MPLSGFLSLLDQSRHDLWRYHRFYPAIKPIYRLSLEKSFTPLLKQNQLADFFKIPALYIKREDFNVTGSHKTRSLAYQISWAKEHGVSRAAISSSGNAAICAARYCELAKIKLTVFFSKKRLLSEAGKLTEIKKYQPDLYLVDKPLTEATSFAQKRGILNLNPSQDDRAIVGFRSLGFELFEQLPDLNKQDAIFIFVSSGSALLGLTEAFSELYRHAWLKSLPQCHLVQGGSLTNITTQVDPRELGSEPTLGVIGMKSMPRESAVLSAIKMTQGWGWTIAHREVEEIATILDNHNFRTGEESMAALAGLERALTVFRKKHKALPFSRAIVIFSGQKW